MALHDFRTIPFMKAESKKNHFIREWRTKRGYSLRKLASMMETEPGVQLISHASLGRIEKGQQPYSEEIMLALADALSATVGQLIEVNPKIEGNVVDLLTELRALSGEQQVRAMAIIEALKKAG